ncbi:hypothetical protein ACX5K5_03990 [Glutamicibacter bergerei]|uniref:Phosphatase PAP2 family protein n=2 Tax=Glutamicibacter TaxID=1742989 RepID=A0ABV9MRY9_9MICC|nr:MULTISPECIES: hypothetical protein [Glutamicibacter]GGJ55193.1 hypothetical protein GCM10007173_12440 [Glutamicibacter ardleyensis]HBV09991.1 hypothetical protein [Micrococcaceae bacterium]
MILASLLLLSTPLRHSEVSWVEVCVATAFTMVLPWLYLLWSTYRGTVTDLHVTRRGQRHKIFALTAVSIGLGLLLLSLMGASQRIFVEVLSILAGLLMVAVINLWWKVSVHMAVGCYVALQLCTSLALVPPVLAFIAVLSWSRIRSQQHTPSQVCGGVIVGIAVSYLSGWIAMLS